MLPPLDRVEVVHNLVVDTMIENGLDITAERDLATLWGFVSQRYAVNETARKYIKRNHPGATPDDLRNRVSLDLLVETGEEWAQRTFIVPGSRKHLDRLEPPPVVFLSKKDRRIADALREHGVTVEAARLLGWELRTLQDALPGFGRRYALANGLPQPGRRARSDRTNRAA